MILKHITPVLFGLLILSCRPKEDPQPAKCTLPVPIATCRDTTDENRYEDWDPNACLLGQYPNTPPKLFSAVSITSRQVNISTGYVPDIVIETDEPVNAFIYCFLPDSSQAQWGNLAEYKSRYRRELGGMDRFEPGCYRLYYALSNSKKEVFTKGHFDIEVVP